MRPLGLLTLSPSAKPCWGLDGTGETRNQLESEGGLERRPVKPPERHPPRSTRGSQPRVGIGGSRGTHHQWRFPQSGTCRTGRAAPRVVSFESVAFPTHRGTLPRELGVSLPPLTAGSLSRCWQGRACARPAVSAAGRVHRSAAAPHPSAGIGAPRRLCCTRTGCFCYWR